jgi:carbamoyltransferase
MIILGINCFHPDSSATIMIDGKIMAASDEERFVRLKHYKGFPVSSIEFCLKKNNLNINDIDILAINYSPLYNLFERLLFLSRNILSTPLLKNKIIKVQNHSSVFKILYNHFGLTKKIKIITVPHHLAHAASSVLCSGLSNGLSISFDGSGDFSTMEVYKFDKKNFKLVLKSTYPHSLGIFYQSICQYLGFDAHGEEYKVMGLAAMGKPRYAEKLRKIINFQKSGFKLNLKYFNLLSVLEENNVTIKYPHFFSRHLVNLLGPQRKRHKKILIKHKDMAASLQFVFEEVTLELVKFIEKKYKYKNLFLSGGCALNSLCNMRILKKTNFKNVFIQPNAGDGGGSLGAALYASNKLDNKFINKKLNSVYLGLDENIKIIKKVLNRFFLNNNKFIYKEFSSTNDLCRTIATKLGNKKIVAWHQGRAEFGPRALGNRSILANPSSLKIKNEINKKIKMREDFRPFGGSVLDTHANRYFNLSDNFDYLYMNSTCYVKNAFKKKIPAVINFDNTSRIQIVKKKHNHKFYKLLEHFYAITDLPVLLNTSLNIDEPICNTSEDTVLTFLNSKIDVLVIENFMVTRK